MHRVTIKAKKRWVVFLMVFLVSLSVCVSCGSGEDGSLSTDSRNSGESTGTESSRPSPDYSNKTKLVYLIPSMNELDESTVNGINEALDQKGAPYYIEFQVLPDSAPSGYGTAVREHIGSADLLFTGWPDSDYLELARENRLLCLDEYLASEEGKELYESLPADNWYAITIGDSVYGVTSYPYAVNTPPSYTANQELMEKYKVSEEELSKPLYELEDVIRRVYEGEKGRDGFAPIRVSPSVCNRFSGEYYISSSVTLNEETGEAHLLIENPEYARWLRCLFDFYRKGYVDKETNYVIEEQFLSVSFSSGVPTKLASDGRYKSQGDENGKAKDIIVGGYSGYSGELSFATAISAESANQEYALDFLTRLFTDSHLTNLMILGEGYESGLDSEGRRKPGTNADNYLVYGNYYISAPSHYDYVDMKDKYFEYHNSLKKSSFTGFHFDSVPVERQINSADLVFSVFLGKLFSTDQDFDTYLAECRQQLLEAGAQDIIDEANRQLDAFKAETGS